MDDVPETYALAVPGGVVTYTLRDMFDVHSRRVGSGPADGLLHRVDEERSIPLEVHQVERYIADFGAGRRLQGSA